MRLAVYEFWGLSPAAHHRVLLVIHVVNVLLLFLLLRKLTSAFWRSLLVASLLAIHPIHTEPVVNVATQQARLAPEKAEVHYQLALLYNQKGSRDMANVHLNKALSTSETAGNEPLAIESKATAQ